MNPQRLAASVVVVAALAAGVAACGDDSPATTAPATTIPETTVPETTVPETTVPETTATSAPTAAPETSMPDGTTAEASVPGSALPTVESATEVLVGLTETEANAAAAEHGWTVRVGRIDGQDQPMTMDFREDRVNVEITDGTVSAVISVG